jgi:beta-lactamase class A
VPVHNRFRSAQPGAAPFGCVRRGDGDAAVWALIGGTATPRWLAHRMITRSSNLATNLVLARVGLPAVARVWDLAGARHSVTARGIEDHAARDAGLENLVTAADLAALFATIARGALGGGSPVADRDRCAEMIRVLLAQRHREDLAAGLPPHARVAHKNGWVRGIRHAAGVVFPDDAAPYAVAVCVSADPAARLADRAAGAAWDAAARALVARVSATAWAARRAGGAG